MVTQSTQPRGGQPVLDDKKKQTVVALLTTGFSRRMAASYVGCAPSTITRTIARDKAFAEEVGRASQQLQLIALNTLRRVAAQDKYWRAAAWVSERLSPQQFGLRQPGTYTAQQVLKLFAQISDALMEEVPEANRRRAEEKVSAMLKQMEIDKGGILVEEFFPESQAAAEPPAAEPVPEASAAEAAPEAAVQASPSEAEACPPDHEPEPSASDAVEMVTRVEAPAPAEPENVKQPHPNCTESGQTKSCRSESCCSDSCQPKPCHADACHTCRPVAGSNASDSEDSSSEDSSSESPNSQDPRSAGPPPASR